MAARDPAQDLPRRARATKTRLFSMGGTVCSSCSEERFGAQLLGRAADVASPRQISARARGRRMFWLLRCGVAIGILYWLSPLRAPEADAGLAWPRVETGLRDATHAVRKLPLESLGRDA